MIRIKILCKIFVCFYEQYEKNKIAGRDFFKADENEKK
jgi:hypothetical protein